MIMNILHRSECPRNMAVSSALAQGDVVLPPPTALGQRDPRKVEDSLRWTRKGEEVDSAVRSGFQRSPKEPSNRAIDLPGAKPERQASTTRCAGAAAATIP